MTINYFCNNCASKKTNEEIESMVCECGGDFRPDGMLFGQAAVFDAGWCETTKTYLTSYRQQEKIAKKQGLVISQDCKGMMKRLRDVRKNKEDVIKETYAKDGHKYVIGKKMRFSDAHGTLVPSRGSGKTYFV